VLAGKLCRERYTRVELAALIDDPLAEHRAIVIAVEADK